MKTVSTDFFFFNSIILPTHTVDSSIHPEEHTPLVCSNIGDSTVMRPH